MLKVTKISNDDVYNMEVETYHNFAINEGLIVHNCMDCLRYICQDIPYNYIGMSANNYEEYFEFFRKFGKIKEEPNSFETLVGFLKNDYKDVYSDVKKQKRHTGGFSL